MRLLKQGSQILGQLALPQDCYLCNSPAGQELLCPECLRQLPEPTPSACPVCALPTPGAQVCGACLAHPPCFDATIARFRYTFPINHLIHGLKYRHHLAISRCLGRMMLDKLPPLPPADGLLPVPLSRQRLAQRGFNQSVELARALSSATGIPLLIDGYTRSLDTVPQATLPWKARHANIRGAFECSMNLAGKRLIVVDDVMTTGASLNEFARTLKKHGATHITNWVLARACRD